MTTIKERVQIMGLFSRLSRRERTWIILAVIVVVGAVADQIAIKPIRQEISRLDQEIVAKKAALKGYRRNVAQRPAVLAEYTEVAAYLERTGSNEQETAKILETVEQLARQSGVTLNQAKPQGARKLDWVTKLKVEIEAQATPEKLVAFLYRLNNAPQVLRTDRVQIRTGDRKSPQVRSIIEISKLVEVAEPRADETG